ncbi:unnamed protein product, partial [Mesorhabditis belari]|uniref:Uncharacterized protein n=1 Tax=Mesorhabditis belari TaxID=2138241 RepID=A0AAF3EA72_9BILA
MDRLQPLQRLEDDYYVGEIGRPAVESDYDSSSDDELQHELKRLAGIPNCKEVKKEKERDEFVDEMESDLDDSISEYARKHMGGSNQDLTKDELPQLVDPTTDNEMETSLPGTSKDTKSTPASKDTKSPKKQKKVTINEDVEMGDAKDGDETNPILKMAKAQLKEKEEKPDFYDSDEDEDNERWIAEKRRQSKGMKKMNKEIRVLLARKVEQK